MDLYDEWKRTGRSKTKRRLTLVPLQPGDKSSNHLDGTARRAADRYQVDLQRASRLARALSSRLQIPHSTTIVGLLAVGPSRNNEDELCKWVIERMPEIAREDWEDQLSILARELMRAIESAQGR